MFFTSLAFIQIVVVVYNITLFTLCFKTNRLFDRSCFTLVASLYNMRAKKPQPPPLSRAHEQQILKANKYYLFTHI